MNRTLLLYGFGIWLAATIFLRFTGQHLLHAGSLGGTLALFALSFAGMALVARGLCRRAGLPRDAWPLGAISLALPTLLLDPFSTAFFSVVFPNMAPATAGLFGGWILCCCAGALLGVTIRNPRSRERIVGA